MASETPVAVLPQEPPVDTVLNEKAAQQPQDTPLAASTAGSTTDEAALPTEKLKASPAIDPEFIEPVPGNPVRKPFTAPLPSCKPSPAPALTAEQQQKYDELLATVSAWESVPASSARDAAAEPITDGERMWLTRECLLRYLRASKWNTPFAAKRLLATLTWRKEYGVYTFTPEYISPENETGKQYILGFDNEGRPCLYLNPGKQNTARSDKQLHHLVYMLERLIDIMAPGQESLALLITFKYSSSGSGGGTPSVAQGKQTLDILQGHYPERLGRALISDLPWYVTTFFKLISPFIDPVTKTKMKFNEPLTDHVPASQLTTQYGGKVDFEYDHSIYWPALAELSDQRKKRQTERWEKAGKKIGEHESYLRGGDVKCLSGDFSGHEV